MPFLIEWRYKNERKKRKKIKQWVSKNEERKAATFEAIKAAAGFVRREISARMHIRTVPEFTFLLDNRAEYGEKIDKILNQIHKNGNGDENA